MSDGQSKVKIDWIDKFLIGSKCSPDFYPCSIKIFSITPPSKRLKFNQIGSYWLCHTTLDYCPSLISENFSDFDQHFHQLLSIKPGNTSCRLTALTFHHNHSDIARPRRSHHLNLTPHARHTITSRLYKHPDHANRPKLPLLPILLSISNAPLVFQLFPPFHTVKMNPNMF